MAGVGPVRVPVVNVVLDGPPNAYDFQNLFCRRSFFGGEAGATLRKSAGPVDWHLERAHPSDCPTPGERLVAKFSARIMATGYEFYAAKLIR
jgi:hypothetical protein